MQLLTAIIESEGMNAPMRACAGRYIPLRKCLLRPFPEQELTEYPDQQSAPLPEIPQASPEIYA